MAEDEFEEDEEDEENLDTEIEEEMQVQKKVKKKTVKEKSGEESTEESGERFIAFHQSERMGIMDTVTNEPIVLAEFDKKATPGEWADLQSQTKMHNDIEKVIVGGGYS